MVPFNPKKQIVKHEPLCKVLLKGPRSPPRDPKVPRDPPEGPHKVPRDPPEDP